MKLPEIEKQLFIALLDFLEERGMDKPNNFTIEDNLFDIDDLDSLDITELFVTFEDVLDIEFPDKFQDFETIKSIKKIAEYIKDYNLLGGGVVEKV
ncbi:acyl carrier protein [Bacillus sp. V-88]|jgi:acyl carrier protein|nr:hypothetical protein B1B00_16915 [Bacillus sp. DSM 27956]PRX72858.1 acyl carrier protein [Bacillus sp. V-88]SLK24209.1 acyl carrier protein [Bacillus sp. V-88]